MRRRGDRPPVRRDRGVLGSREVPGHACEALFKRDVCPAGLCCRRTPGDLRFCWWMRCWPWAMPRSRRSAWARWRSGRAGAHGPVRQPQYGGRSTPVYACVADSESGRQVDLGWPMAIRPTSISSKGMYDQASVSGLPPAAPSCATMRCSAVRLYPDEASWLRTCLLMTASPLRVVVEYEVRQPVLSRSLRHVQKIFFFFLKKWGQLQI